MFQARITASLLALAALTLGCATLAPRTTKVVEDTGIAGAPDAATIVFARPVAYNHEGEELRILDEARRSLADLGVGEHAVVRTTPGAHTFFAFAWSSGIEQRWCVGALRATLAAGKVYAVRAATYPSLSFHAPWVSLSDQFDCLRVELYAVPAAERPSFWSWVRTRSTRVALRTDLPPAPLLDARWRGTRTLAKGEERMARGPAWSPVWSTLAPADGDAFVR